MHKRFCYAWLAAGILAMGACRKIAVPPSAPLLTMADVQAHLRQQPGWQHSRLQQLQAHGAGTQPVWLAQYTDSAGHSQQLALQQQPQPDGSWRLNTITCESTQCNCGVELYQQPNGELDVRCSCTPCTMIIR